jgi:hypothetical protein
MASDVLDAIDRSEALQSRSLLGDWMRQNHDAFAQRLQNKRADWVVLAALFGEAGLKDRFGNAPKPETARKTWLRVRAQTKASRAARGARPQTLPTPVRAAPAPDSTAPANASDDVRAMLSPGRKVPDIIT